MAEPREALTEKNKASDESMTQEEIMEGGGYIVGHGSYRRSATLRHDGAAPPHRTKLEARERRGDVA